MKNIFLSDAFQASAIFFYYFNGCICLPSLIIFYSNEFYGSVFNVILVNGLFEYEQQNIIYQIILNYDMIYYRVHQSPAPDHCHK